MEITEFINKVENMRKLQEICKKPHSSATRKWLDQLEKSVDDDIAKYNNAVYGEGWDETS